MANFGKYRGKVIDPIDPLGLGRIVALVPAVSELPLSWALPAVPFAGAEVGFFALPRIGANVWIEFEGGDLNYPVWTGCFWGEGECPAAPALPTTFMLKTLLGELKIDDLAEQLTLSLTAPTGLMSLTMDPSGIKLAVNEVSITITMEAITLAHPPSTHEVSPEGITSTCGAASVNVSPASVTIANAAASIDVSPAAISLQNGAGSIEISPATVSINNGALEVI